MLKRVTLTMPENINVVCELGDYVHTKLDLSLSIPSSLWVCITNYFSKKHTSVVEDIPGAYFILAFTYKDSSVNKLVVNVINFINVVKDFRVHDVICTKHIIYLYIRRNASTENKRRLHFIDCVLTEYINNNVTPENVSHLEDLPLTIDIHTQKDKTILYRGIYEVTVPLNVLISKLKPKEDGQYISKLLYCDQHWMQLHSLVISRLVDYFYYIEISKIPTSGHSGMYNVVYYKCVSQNDVNC